MNTHARRSMKANVQLAALLVALSINAPALAECQGSENSAVPVSTPTDAFFDFGNGTVLHRPTQLVWMRCAIGQDWTGSGCSGEPELVEWADALNAAAQFEIAGQSDWRVPNRNELGSIIETRCHGPAINGAIFPGSPSAVFWTSSPSTAEPDQVWTVQFDQGELLARPATDSGALRLVRGGRF